MARAGRGRRWGLATTFANSGNAANPTDIYSRTFLGAPEHTDDDDDEVGDVDDDEDHR